jgi:hypothetical protein
LSKLKRWQTAAEVRAHRKAQAKYQESPLEIRKRENRNKARYDLEKEGKISKHDGMDVEHANGNALDNKPSNWKVGTEHNNRSYPRTKKAHKLYKTS